MKIFSVYLLCYFMFNISLAQLGNPKLKIPEECGTPQIPDSIAAKQKWYGNNNYLLEVLKSNGYDLPPDYFDEIDERGFYKGKRLNIADYKRDKKNQGKPNNSGRSGVDENSPEENLTLNGQTVKYIRVKAFVHLDANGLGWTAAEINTQIAQANDFFRLNNVPIIFLIQGCNDINFIHNSQFSTLTSTQHAVTMLVSYWFNNSMSFHFVNSAPASGMALTTGPMLYVNRANRGVATLTHEIGHVLGLEHTHNPRLPCSAAGNEDCADCWQESVSRTRTQPLWCAINVGSKKCSINGDYLCDTPGEPNLAGHVSDNCGIQWSEFDATDNWGAQWQPMDFNIMSYARSDDFFRTDCRDLFSPAQIAIMLASNLYYAIAPEPYTISGPSVVCVGSGHTYSVPSLPGVTNYTWVVPAGISIVTGQGTNSIIVVFTNNIFNQTIRVTPNCGFPYSQVAVNALSSLFISGNQFPLVYQQATYTTNFLPNGNYTWSFPGWGYAGGGSDFISLIAPSYAGPAFLSVSYTDGSCSLYGELNVEVQEGGGIFQLKAKQEVLNNDPTGISIYEPTSGKFIMLGTYSEGWDQIPRGFHIIRVAYPNRSETIKIIKQ